MTDPHFENDGIDRTTFAPVKLIDQRHSEWKDVRLSFDAWDQLEDAVQTAQLASDILRDRSKIAAMIRIARANGFED